MDARDVSLSAFCTDCCTLNNPLFHDEFEHGLPLRQRKEIQEMLREKGVGSGRDGIEPGLSMALASGFSTVWYWRTAQCLIKTNTTLGT